MFVVVVVVVVVRVLVYLAVWEHFHVMLLACVLLTFGSVKGFEVIKVPTAKGYHHLAAVCLHYRI